MKRASTLTFALALVCAYFLTCPPRAYAYLDPGTGSYILQIVMASLLGSIFALKLCWGRIKLFVQARTTGRKP